MLLNLLRVEHLSIEDVLRKSYVESASLRLALTQKARLKEVNQNKDINSNNFAFLWTNLFSIKFLPSVSVIPSTDDILKPNLVAYFCRRRSIDFLLQNFAECATLRDLKFSLLSNKNLVICMIKNYSFENLDL